VTDPEKYEKWGESSGVEPCGPTPEKRGEGDALSIASPLPLICVPDYMIHNLHLIFCHKA
jgi:hypothetical protein